MPASALLSGDTLTFCRRLRREGADGAAGVADCHANRNRSELRIVVESPAPGIGLRLQSASIGGDASKCQIALQLGVANLLIILTAGVELGLGVGVGVGVDSCSFDIKLISLLHFSLLRCVAAARISALILSSVLQCVFHKKC